MILSIPASIPACCDHGSEKQICGGKKAKKAGRSHNTTVQQERHGPHFVFAESEKNYSEIFFLAFMQMQIEVPSSNKNGTVHNLHLQKARKTIQKYFFSLLCKCKLWTMAHKITDG
jgi:hypothetical protein